MAHQKGSWPQAPPATDAPSVKASRCERKPPPLADGDSRLISDLTCFGAVDAAGFASAGAVSFVASRTNRVERIPLVCTQLRATRIVCDRTANIDLWDSQQGSASKIGAASPTSSSRATAALRQQEYRVPVSVLGRDSLLKIDVLRVESLYECVYTYT